VIGQSTDISEFGVGLNQTGTPEALVSLLEKPEYEPEMT
jgi:hypothetical protein